LVYIRDATPEEISNIARRSYVEVYLMSFLPQSKLQLPNDASFAEASDKPALRLGLFSYPVLQAADILVHRFVMPSSMDGGPASPEFLITEFQSHPCSRRQ
jgi:tryptophanyl-tRNA synthetase